MCLCAHPVHTRQHIAHICKHTTAVRRGRSHRPSGLPRGLPLRSAVCGCAGRARPAQTAVRGAQCTAHSAQRAAQCGHRACRRLSQSDAAEQRARTSTVPYCPYLWPISARHRQIARGNTPAAGQWPLQQCSVQQHSSATVQPDMRARTVVLSRRCRWACRLIAPL